LHMVQVMSLLSHHFLLHSIQLERVMDANKDLKGGITVHGVSINNMRFADDIDLTFDAVGLVTGRASGL